MKNIKQSIYFEVLKLSISDFIEFDLNQNFKFISWGKFNKGNTECVNKGDNILTIQDKTGKAIEIKAPYDIQIIYKPNIKKEINRYDSIIYYIPSGYAKSELLIKEAGVNDKNDKQDAIYLLEEIFNNINYIYSDLYEQRFNKVGVNDIIEKIDRDDCRHLIDLIDLRLNEYSEIISKYPKLSSIIVKIYFEIISLELKSHFYKELKIKKESFVSSALSLLKLLLYISSSAVFYNINELRIISYWIVVVYALGGLRKIYNHSDFSKNNKEFNDANKIINLNEELKASSVYIPEMKRLINSIPNIAINTKIIKLIDNLEVQDVILY